MTDEDEKVFVDELFSDLEKKIQDEVMCCEDTYRVMRHLSLVVDRYVMDEAEYFKRIKTYSEVVKNVEEG